MVLAGRRCQPRASAREGFPPLEVPTAPWQATALVLGTPCNPLARWIRLSKFEITNKYLCIKDFKVK